MRLASVWKLGRKHMPHGEMPHGEVASPARCTQRSVSVQLYEYMFHALSQ